MNVEIQQTKPRLHVLHLEDNSWDAELIKLELERTKIPCSITQVWTEKDFEDALRLGGVDIFLSDSQLPGYETLKALARTREVCPDVPFVFVSGTSSPTQKANAFFRGAADFIQKDELFRLVPLMDRLFLRGTSTGTMGIDPLPEIGVPVVVRCDRFTCLGYLDREGKWRDYARSTELPNVIDWSDL
jgi:CheY-like chemotaxis protein